MYRKFLHTSSIVLISLCSMSVTFADDGTTAATNKNLKIERGQDNNKVRMLRGQNGPISIRDTSSRALHEKVANQFAPQFGIRNPSQQLRVKKQRADNAKTHIRYGQLQQGLPVIGGELVANLNEQNQLMSMSGETSSAQLADTTPTISAEQASDTAIKAVAKWYQLNPDQLIASTPVLSVYDPSLIIRTRSSSSLVWQLNVAPNTIAPINEYFLIDAKKGGVVLHFNKVDSARNRRTYTANNTEDLPGSLICNEATDPCGSGDPDIEAAHDYARDTYDFYFTINGRDSIDDAGMALVSTTHYGNIQNAFWSGSDNQMIYGDGFSLGDDVVAHELTHGVTENTSNLFYFYESGAINESLSDVWGEFVDKTNGVADTANNWEIGEDLPIGAFRDMRDPGIFGDPDRMTSNNFYTGDLDNGGVHWNSGVNNKAAYLMVEGSAAETGGMFNNVTIAGLSGATLNDRIFKASRIYYEAQTNLLTTASDYLDLYNALNQACTNLLNTNGIVQADCDQVLLVTQAVEMNLPPNATYAPSAEICVVGNVYDLFFDDFEANNLSNWTINNIIGTSKWSTGNTFLAGNSGTTTAEASGHNGITDDSDSSLQLTTALYSPTSTTAYIHFDQYFFFENYSTNDTNYDGGVIEYSIDNGSTWTDAGNLIESGRSYTGELASTNPESGRSAFTGFSRGFNSTRLNLSSLAGNFVHIRFRSLADESVASGPWTIDNFRVYLCANNAPPIPNAGPDQNVRGNDNVVLAGSVTDPDGDPFTYQWTQTSGTQVTLNNATTLSPSFTAPSSTGDLVFELSATSNGVTETDTVNITVNFFLTGSNGGGGSGCTVSESGRFDPLWLLFLLFLAGIHLRNRQGKNNQKQKAF